MSAVTASKPMHLHEKIGEIAHLAYDQSASTVSKIGRGIASVAHNIDQGIWKDRAVAKLDRLDAALEKKMPNFAFQNKLDHLGTLIQKKFAPLGKFNTWLDSNGHGAWDLKLATFLVKLPLRVARNIINLLYQIIKGIIYFAVHPLKSLNAIAKLIVKLIHELTKPETWTQMGIGMMGASIGQTLVTGNLITLIGIGIGGAMAIGGLSFGALKAAIKANKGSKLKAVYDHLQTQAIKMPETMLTGLCMGAMMGGIEKAINQRPITRAEKREFLDRFIKENDLPKEKWSHVNKNDGPWGKNKGDINVQWDDWKGEIYRKHPDWFSKSETPTLTRVNIRFRANEPPRIQLSGYYERYQYPYFGEQYYHSYNLDQLGYKGAFYPKKTGLAEFQQSGYALGCAEPLLDTRSRV